MKIYYSNWYGFEDHKGIHLLPETLGKNHELKKTNNEADINFQIYYVKSKNLVKKIGDVMVLSSNTRDIIPFFEHCGRRVKTDHSYSVYEITDLCIADELVSIPISIDYYKAVAALFDEGLALKYLSRICDVSYYKENISIYNKMNGFKTRFYRDNSSSKAIIKNGLKIATGGYEIDEKVHIKINDLGDSFEPVDFIFDKSNDLVQDINLIIGKNGLGKTHILKEICSIVTGLKTSKSKPLFNKLIIVSYSPFESFYTNRELSTLLSLKYGKEDVGNTEANFMSIDDYTYIGFRDIDGKFDKNKPASFSAKSIINAIEYDRDIAWWADGNSGKVNTIFSTLSLSMKFDTIRFKKVNGGEVDLRLNNNKIEFNDEGEEINFHDGVTFHYKDQDVKLSSGQQIYSFMIPSIVGEIQDETLIIIDEPELYLHPALEVGLIEMLKNILKQRNSYAIIATHSAVIAREVPRKCVSVLKESDYGTKIDKPNIETYGESLDEIIGEIFDDYSLKKPYQYEIDRVVNEDGYSGDKFNDLSERLGDEGLVYLASKFRETIKI